MFEKKKAKVEAKVEAKQQEEKKPVALEPNWFVRAQVTLPTGDKIWASRKYIADGALTACYQFIMEMSKSGVVEIERAVKWTKRHEGSAYFSVYGIDQHTVLYPGDSSC